METREPNLGELLDALANRWAVSLSSSQLRVVIYLVSRGYVEERAMPRAMLPELARHAGRSMKTISDTLRSLVRSGWVREWYDTEGRVVYSVAWSPEEQG